MNGDEFNKEQQKFDVSKITEESFKNLFRNLESLLKTKIFIEGNDEISNEQLNAAFLRGYEEIMRIVKIYNETFIIF
jgi:hypothetical protein